jgi:hypothetical protein
VGENIAQSGNLGYFRQLDVVLRNRPRVWSKAAVSNLAMEIPWLGPDGSIPRVIHYCSRKKKKKKEEKAKIEDLKKAWGKRFCARRIKFC